MDEISHGETFAKRYIPGIVLQPLVVLRVVRSVVAPAPDCFASTTCQTIAQRLQELGYVEGQNLRIEFRTAAGQADRLPALAAELVRLQVDIMVAAGPEPRCRPPGTPPVSSPLS